MFLLVSFRHVNAIPNRWAPTWRLHTKLYKLRQNISPSISHMKNWINLKLGEHLRILTLLHFPHSVRYLLNCVTGLWKERGRGFRAREKGDKRTRGGVGNAGKEADVFFLFTSTREIKKSLLIRIPNKSIWTSLACVYPKFSVCLSHVFFL